MNSLRMLLWVSILPILSHFILIDVVSGVDDMLEGASPNEPDSADADAIE